MSSIDFWVVEKPAGEHTPPAYAGKPQYVRFDDDKDNRSWYLTYNIKNAVWFADERSALAFRDYVCKVEGRNPDKYHITSHQWTERD